MYQTDLSDDDRKQKEYKVLNSAVKDLNSYWNEKTHDDFKICSVGVGCDGSLQNGITPVIIRTMKRSKKCSPAVYKNQS